MGKAPGLVDLSQFIGSLHEVRAERDGQALLQWAAAEMSRIVGFEAAWFGWADLAIDHVEIIGSQVLNLPEGFFDFWSSIREEDLLAAEAQSVQAVGPIWAHYDRFGDRQTEGIIALTDRYGLHKLSAISRRDDGLRPQLFLSAYRAGNRARGLNKDELTFLSCALDHLQAAFDRQQAEGDASSRLLIDGNSRPVAGSPVALELWARWRAEAASKLSFADFLEQSGLKAVTRPEAFLGDQVLSELRIVPHRLEDCLSSREREVAEQIAQGQTYKEIARTLGLSPTTVRNYTARIYAKANVKSRAALASILSRSVSTVLPPNQTMPRRGGAAQ